MSPRRDLPNFASDCGKIRGGCSPSGGYPYPYKEELLWDRTSGIAISDPKSLTSRRTSAKRAADDEAPDKVAGEDKEPEDETPDVEAHVHNRK